MTDHDELKILPEWRQAIRDFLAAGFKEGDIVPHAWFEQHFGMEPLSPDTEITVADYNSRQFSWLRNFDAFRTELLEQHQICLCSVQGEGYRIIPPSEQSALALERFEREAKKSFRKAGLTLKHVRLNELTEAERRENVDAIAKLSQLRGMVKAIE